MYEPSIAQHRPSCFHNVIAPLSDLSPMLIPVLRLQLPACVSPADSTL